MLACSLNAQLFWPLDSFLNENIRAAIERHFTKLKIWETVRCAVRKYVRPLVTEATQPEGTDLDWQVQAMVRVS